MYSRDQSGQYAALKTKGLRRRTVFVVFVVITLSVCSPENKGIETILPVVELWNVGSVCSPENKGIETGIFVSIYPKEELSVCSLENKGIETAQNNATSAPVSQYAALKTKGLRPAEPRRSPMIKWSVCSPENKGIETFARLTFTTFLLSVCSPENKGIETFGGRTVRVVLIVSMQP